MRASSTSENERSAKPIENVETRALLSLGGQRGQRGGVDAAREQHADGHVGDEVRAHGVAQALAQLARQRLPRLVAQLRDRRGPVGGVALEPRRAVLEHEHVARRQLADLAEDRARRRGSR